jgi:hypothetical protein
VNEMICFGSGGEVMSAMKIFLHFRYVCVQVVPSLISVPFFR